MQPHTSSQRYVRLIMTFTVGLCMLAMSALAQSNTGNIVGSVTLKGGGPLPGVTIWLAGLPPGTELHTTTDVEGSFRFLNLSPGKYSVRAEAQGCSKAFATVDVAAGKNTQVALTIALLAAEEPYARKGMKRG